MNQVIAKHKGVLVKLNGDDYTIPPLNLRALEALQEKITKFTGGQSVEQLSIVADIATAAIQRNYPDVTRDQLTDWIDLGNMAEIMSAVMGVSGLMSSGEAKGTESQ